MQSYLISESPFLFGATTSETSTNPIAKICSDYFLLLNSKESLLNLIGIKNKKIIKQVRTDKHSCD